MAILLNNIWKNKSGRTGLVMLITAVLVFFIMPGIVRLDPDTQDLSNIFQKPGTSHILGTDNLGRDIFARLVHGSRLSLAISLWAAVIAVFIGLVMGSVSGLSKGKTGFVIMRISDLFLGFPKYFAFILILGFGPFHVLNIIMALALFSWMETAKMVRNEIHYLKSSLFYKAALCQGLSKGKILRHYLVPNLVGVVISSFSIQTAAMIILESGLSFVGLGVQAPAVSLGTMLNQARYFPFANTSLITFTGIFIVFNVAAFHLLGDGLKMVLNQEKYQK